MFIIRQCSAWIFAGFILIGLLGLPVMSLAAEQGWVEKAKMPTARRSAAAAVLDGKIYVIGGAVGEWPWQAVSAVEAYDPAKDEWTKKADMPAPRFRLSACAVNGKIYAIGGTQSDEVDITLAKVEEYDPATDKWTKKADMPTARHSLSTSAVDGKIYAIGGAKGAIVVGDAVAFDTVEEYNPATDTWVKKADMITPRYGHAAGIVRGKIYIVGGVQDPGAAANTVEEYDPAKNKWTEKADAPTVRLFHTASVTNNKIYAIGGVGDLGGENALPTMEEYNPATDTWTKKADMPSARSAVSSGVVNGKIYVFGGWLGWILGVFGAGNLFPTVEEYTPEDWSVSPQGKLVSTWAMIKTSSGF